MSRRLLLLVPLLLFMGLAVLLYRGLYLDPKALPSALVGQPLPAFSLPAVNDPGRQLTAETFRGGPALVNVWATWCTACRAEHPVLNWLAGQGVRILGVNYKDDPRAARQWLQDFQDPYQLDVSDGQGTLGLDLGVYGAPETFFVDRQGVIRYRHAGPITEALWREQLASRYEELLRR